MSGTAPYCRGLYPSGPAAYKTSQVSNQLDSSLQARDQTYAGHAAMISGHSRSTKEG
jgi:hypothetical protein